MKTIETVRGKVSTDDLGSVLMHEHVMCSSMGIAGHYPQFYRPDYEEVILKDMKQMMDAGIRTFVDATCVGLGRDVHMLKRISERSGMNIVTVSGWWGAEPPYLGPNTEDQWARCFIDEVTVGCDGTDIKAGMLKAYMDVKGPTEFDLKIHRAVGIASVETGAPIMLHTYMPMETPRHQLKALKEVGADMNKVVVDHLPETCDLDFVRWVYDQGAWLGFDRIPILLFPGQYAVPTERRIRFLKEILDAGMGDKLLFSHDMQCAATLYDNQPQDVQDFVNALYPDRFLSLKNRVFPAVAEMGYDEAALWQMTIDHPKKFFEG